MFISTHKHVLGVFLMQTIFRQQRCLLHLNLNNKVLPPVINQIHVIVSGENVMSQCHYIVGLGRKAIQSWAVLRAWHGLTASVSKGWWFRRQRQNCTSNECMKRKGSPSKIDWLYFSPELWTLYIIENLFKSMTRCRAKVCFSGFWTF